MGAPEDSQGVLGSRPTLSFPGCVLWGKVLPLSDPQFSPTTWIITYPLVGLY